MSSPKYYWDIVQGTEQWDAIRAGKWSASRAGTIMGGLETKGLDDLVMDIAWGRVYGPIEHGSYKSAAMDRGHDLEPETRERYSFMTDHVIDECGFVEHSSIPNVGWSPDGITPSRKHAVEAKNPLHKAFMEVRRTGKIPAEYRWQCKWAAWVGELDSLDFLCHHPAAGLIVIPSEVTESEKDQMAARVSVLEPRVEKWIEILTERKAA